MAGQPPPTSLSQPSLLQFFRPQNSRLSTENLRPPNTDLKKREIQDPLPVAKRRKVDEPAKHELSARPSRGRLVGRLMVASSDDDASPEQATQGTTNSTEEQKEECSRFPMKVEVSASETDTGQTDVEKTDDWVMPEATGALDDEVSNPGDVESLLANLDRDDGGVENWRGPSWYEQATQQSSFWPLDDSLSSVAATTMPSQASLPDESVLKAVGAEEEAEFEAKQLFYLNKVPISQGPQSRFWKAYVEAFYENCTRFKFPRWIDPQHLRDIEGRTADDPMFDCEKIRCNLDPKGAEPDKMHFTPAMIQYWQVKKDHFNKMIFFKLGKFYELFYTDACILQPLCDLKWMASDEKAHVGFPESSLQWFARKVIDAGFAVTVVEQMETPGELQERSRSTVGGAKPKAVHREVCEIYTRGTVAHQKMIGLDPVYLLTIVFEDQIPEGTGSPTTERQFAYILTDVSTSEMFFGSAIDRVSSRHALRTLLAHSAPHEVLVAKGELPMDAIAIFSNLPTAPKVTYSNKSLRTVDHDTLGSSNLQGLLSECETNLLLSLACQMLYEYLKELLMDERVLRFAQCSPWDPSESRKMQLDGAVLDALEVLTSRGGEAQGRNQDRNSLFGVLNHCCSAFGGRLLRRWLRAPLTNAHDLNARQDAVEWLRENPSELSELRTAIKELPDLERLSARTCAQALQGSRGAVFFTHTAEKRIGQFLELMAHFRNLQRLIDTRASAIKNGTAPPDRLGRILNRTDNEGFFPNLDEIINSLTSQVHVVGDGKFLPKPGVFASYDDADAVVEQKKVEMQQFLDETLFPEVLGLELSSTEKKLVQYRDIKFRYEVEVPETLWAKIEARKRKGLVDVTVTSCKKDIKRFHTNELRDLVAELEARETKRSNELYPFMQGLFVAFNDHAQKFAAATSLVGELDVLSAFAFVSDLWPVACRPNLLVGEPTQVRMRKAYHPIFACTMDGFVPNDLELGTKNEPPTTLILTGPNMGGKSTLARQVALLVLMAQVGCFVPAEVLELTLMDRLFARVGAHDAILEGKSTFYVELEETHHILESATNRSLCVIDEFGRGTSIEEGAALAQATVRFLSDNVGALCLFSTHFQEQLHRSLSSDPKICFFHMAALADETNNQIVFLYKLKKGLCPDSHGLKVAKIAGVPLSVLRRAEEARAISTGVSRFAECDGREHSSIKEAAGKENNEQQT